ncbi:hypothetical protein RFI_27337 [Reticulomyxa filosa]|uniref:Uncharacterized protein n=1 Tax=Reticulomyxa filosa TaxID=46433 RepID=X6M8Q6_RETFI|nr:hypothetical protein RFI_27337 [Reticulomyxa filosa]|eukprot:ETO10041.1 hypothetical protein RFI_27337 [Reticulomyxa filosa]
MYEDEQTQLAIEASQRESYRNLRVQQDEEYAEALRQQAELDKKTQFAKDSNHTNTNAAAGITTNNYNWTETKQSNFKEVSEMTTPLYKTSTNARPDAIARENNTSQVDVVVDEFKDVQLDELPVEPSSFFVYLDTFINYILLYSHIHILI